MIDISKECTLGQCLMPLGALKEEKMRGKFSAILFSILLIFSGIAVGQGKKASAKFTFTVTVAKYIEIVPGPIDWNQSGSIDFAYANCPFSATISGEHPGNSPNISKIALFFNGQNHDFVDWTQRVSQFPFTKNYYEAPHNGQVRLDISVKSESHTGPSPLLKITLTPL